MALVAARLGLLLLLAAGGNAVSVPKTLWAQRTHLLYLRVVTPGLLRESVRVDVNDTHVGLAGKSAEGEDYGVTLHMFRRIESRQVTWDVASGHVSFVVHKKWHWIYWPRLLRDPKDKTRAYVGIDWKRWKIESEDEDADTLMGPGQDEDWLDEDLAQKKAARFPFEEKPDTHLPLLNETSFVEFVGKHDMSAVLFFDRERRGKHMTNACANPYYAWAGLAIALAGDNITLAAVDVKASPKVAKKLHVVGTPVAKIFFKDGDMFQFDPMALKDTKGLGNFLYRQVQPAFKELTTEKEALEHIESFRKVALMVLDSNRDYTGILLKKKKTKHVVAEDIFDLAAKQHRATPDLLPVAYAKLKAPGGLADMPLLLEKLNVTTDFQGIVLHKKEEERFTFTGPWIKKAISDWVYRSHFNILEYITPSTFNEYRKRKIPMLYVMLYDRNKADGEEQDAGLSNETVAEFKTLLDDVRETARNYAGRVSFVYTAVERTGDLMDHLRCEFKNATFAVLEDFEEEYRYCVESTEENPLTIGRINKLVDGYMSQDKSLEPDKVRSQPVPKKNPGTGGVYDVVGDTLIAFSMDENVDSIIHFYAEFDETHEKSDYELQKLAETLEDVKTIRVGRIDGMKNERPKNFIDPGFFPCTIAFPADSKMQPVFFNKTAGFTKDRLLGWVSQMAYFPIHNSTVPDKEMKFAEEEYGLDVPIRKDRRDATRKSWKYPGTDRTVEEQMRWFDEREAQRKANMTRGKDGGGKGASADDAASASATKKEEL